MTENEKKEGAEEPTPADAGTGDKPETARTVDDINLAAKRMEEATKAAKEEREAAVRDYANMKRGGVTNAGTVEKIESEDEKWAKDAKIRYAGTGMDPTDDDGK